MIIMFVDKKPTGESYTNINKLNDTNKQVVNFAEDYGNTINLDDHTVMLRNFRKRKLEKKIIQ